MSRLLPVAVRASNEPGADVLTCGYDLERLSAVDSPQSHAFPDHQYRSSGKTWDFVAAYSCAGSDGF